MKRASLFAIISASCCAAAQAANLEIPATVVQGTDVFSGPTFTVSGNFTASDFIDVQATGTVDLDSGNFTANAAGIIVAPPITNTGATPGQTSPNGFNGLPFAALLIGNNSLGFFPLFPANAANGLGNPTPPTTVSVNDTLGSIFGASVVIPDGTVLELEVNDFNDFDNSGSFTVGAVNGVPDAGCTSELLGLSLLGLAAVRRRLA